ncbi:hypothetical protein [Brevibacillus centrosporus]|uniref:YtkA-like n=1 Tax=Brevibacillus centrosporus TaxID=54910 RepID=A0A1I3KWZ5_9BACL|nr:hypothetical protein [Brevibacillus centrosporus]MED4907129.1 hypothetical protein [Brevibacillus centrosporus]SFI77003.1 hypothetical protein SAMN05518846_101117 [Brevibacillus centrosporus]
MYKWVIGAVLYVALVIGGFTVYEKVTADDKDAVALAKQDSHESHGAQENHGHDTDLHKGGNSEVNTFVQANENEIKIYVKDKAGNPVHDLEVNHEKILHFIVVDEHLQKYYHLHPEQTGKGQFTIKSTLPEGFYKAFIDMKPKNLAYQVTPVPFIVGHPSVSDQNIGMKVDKTLTQQIDGETVTLKMSSFAINQPVTLTFDLDRTNLTTYLGAMGHVVIVDEGAQQYLHVHPAQQEEPVFETQFVKPGIYKIWAEFKQDGKVRAFPFVVEIKGEK